MRNLKKFMAVLLVVVMIATAMVPAFAETTTLSADATICKNLGMLEGADASGVTAAYTATTPSRIQAAVLFLRLKGLEDEAKAFTGTANFADVKADAWYAPITAYLKANVALGFEGVADNTFDADSKMTAQAYYKVVLTALGYKQGTDFTWDEVFTFAASKSLSKVAAATNFTVNDLAIATVEGLKATVKGSNDTLAAVLVTAGAIDEDAAVAAGVYTAPPTVLAVESVKALNLKQLEVVFNMEVDEDSAEDASNYDLSNDGSASLTGAAFALQDDDKTVIITFADGSIASQQDEYDLTIDGVLDTDENALDEVTFEDIEFLDTTLPTAVEAEVIGIDTIKVTFSEPVVGPLTKSDFKINDGDLYIKNITQESNNTVAKVVLYSDLEEGTLSVAVKSSIKDYAVFGVVPKTFELDVVEDTTAPKVVSYKDADTNEVTLVFDEDIKLASGAAVADFYHTNSNNKVDVLPTVDGNELTLTFNTDELPEGIAYVYIEDDIISDYWDNENASKIMVKVEITVDSEAPVLEEIDVNAENKITLTFSEDVADVDKADFTVVDSDDETVNIKRVTVSGEEVTIEFYDNLSGDYSITVEGVEDEAGNEIDEVSMDFTVEDETAPIFNFTAKIYDPSADGQKIVIDFGEEMSVEGTYSVLDLAKYVVDGKDLSDLDCNVTIKAVNNGDSVEIRIPSTAEDNDDGVDFSVNEKIVIARVADAAGNYTAALASGLINLDGAATIAITDAVATATDTIEVTFDDEFSDFDADDLIVYVDTNGNGYELGEEIDIAGIDLDTNDDGESVATITLDDAIDADGKDGGNPVEIATVAAASIDSENEYGDTLVASANNIAVSDEIVPEIAEDGDDNALVTAYNIVGADDKIDTIVIEYTEAIDAGTITKLTYSVDDITVTGVRVSDAATAVLALADAPAATGKFVVITLDNADSDLENDPAYEPTVVQKADLEDANGNTLEASTDAIDSMDAAAPKLATVALASDDKTLTITFNESIVYATDAVALKAGILLDAAGAVPDPLTDGLAAGDTVTISGDTLTVKFATALTTDTNRVTINASALKDASGNASGAYDFTAIKAATN